MNEEKLRISKIDAARRQLDCAIELWFFDKDEISIHTLAAAAYQIIHDLKVHKGIVRDLLYDSAMIKDEYRNDRAIPKADFFTIYVSTSANQST